MGKKKLKGEIRKLQARLQECYTPELRDLDKSMYDGLLTQNAALFQDRQQEREVYWRRIAELEKQLNEVVAERDTLRERFAKDEQP